MSRQFGDAKYGGDFKKNDYRKLKDGRNVYRILPPIGDLAKDGKWSIFYSVHYGYANTQGKLRPFQSTLVKNRKTKMIEVPDAASERIDLMKAQFVKAKAEGNKTAIETLEFLVGKKAKYNLDNNHHVNALDEQGNVVVLKLRHRCKLVLDEEIKRLRAEGIEPLSVVGGRAFVFTRTGNALDTSFKVEVLKQKITTEQYGVVEQDVVSTLDEATIKRCLKEAADLDKLYKKISSEDVARIVKSSDLMTGKSSVVDELFDKGNTAAAAQEEETGYDEDDAKEASAAQSAPAQVATAIASVPGAAEALGANTVAAAIATAAPTQPQVIAPKTEVAQAPVAPAAPAAKTLSEMSTDEFLASLNTGNQELK